MGSHAVVAGAGIVGPATAARSCSRRTGAIAVLEKESGIWLQHQTSRQLHGVVHSGLYLSLGRAVSSAKAGHEPVPASMRRFAEAHGVRGADLRASGDAAAEIGTGAGAARAERASPSRPGKRRRRCRMISAGRSQREYERFRVSAVAALRAESTSAFAVIFAGSAMCHERSDQSRQAGRFAARPTRSPGFQASRPDAV